MRNKISNFLQQKKNKAFTLVELIVSISIFFIIIIAVTNIFISSNNISSKADINRVMQENIKNIVENISEDIRKYWIKWVSSVKPDTDCNTSWIVVWKFESWNKLCTGASKYYLVKKGTMLRVTDIMNECNDIFEVCTLLKDWEPLSNSFVTFKDLSFKISEWPINKVSINFIIQPAPNKGIKSKLIENSKIIFQTTITEKLIKTN